ncbi:MAG: hypothetical protein E7329_06220 [Clostridiales bacterium]|nr:hypothetical protein [Clostridiales bacterium]
MDEKLLKEHAQRLVMLSMKFLQLAYQEQMGKSGGHMALMVLAAAMDSFLEEIENVPCTPLSHAEAKEQSLKFQEIILEMKSLLNQTKFSTLSAPK